MVWVYYGLFNQSLVEQHLSYSQFLTVTNKAAVNIRELVMCECRFPFLWDKCPEGQLLGHMLIACLVLQETARLFSRVAVPIS